MTGRLITAALLALVCAWAQAQVIEPYQPDEHTLLLYHFDGEGDQIIDSGPLGLHGQMNEGTPERVEGIIGRALRLEPGRFVRIDGGNPALRGMDQLTIELWLRSSNEDLGRRQRTICFWEHYIITIFEGNRITGHIYGPGGESAPGAKHVLSAKTTLVPHQWTHVALTYDGKRARLFVNGMQQVSLKMTGPVNGDDIRGLTISTPGADGFAGEIDEVRISSIARTSFIAPRQLDICHLSCDLGLSPGNFRAVFTPLVPQGVEQITCRASLGEREPVSAVIEGDALEPLGDEPWLEGKAEVLLPVPEGVEGEDTVACSVSYNCDGKPRVIERQFAVRVETMQPVPETEVRAAWTHSHRIEDPDDLFSRMAAGGLNTAVMRVRRGETAYFDSKMGPVVKLPFDNANFMAETITAAKRHGIDLHAYVNNFPIGTPNSEFAQQLRAEGRWQKDPNGNDIAWMCPSDQRNIELVRDAMVELARDYDLAGVQYDFIRFPNDRGCYCERCRAKFEERIGRRVANWPADVLKGGELYEQYTDFRCDLITNAVRVTSAAVREVNPDLIISAAVFAMDPEKARHSVGQAWAQWAHEGLVDVLCPMSYTYDTRAFEDTVSTIIEAVEGTVPIWAGIGVRSGAGVMHYPEELAAKINIVRRLGLPGFNMFCVTPTTDVPETILIPLRESVLAGDGRG
ncbi:MAG: family 10 glycosylhydrolase [Armatimonadetes bacterium]|nr:family 10 glycosylhydrolase [Armatimonadota bacterium]